MDLDLNRQPVQPQSLPCEGDPPGSRRMLIELGDDHGRIEERIRLLESVVARARHRPPQNQPPNPTLISSSTMYTREFNGVGGIPEPKPQCDHVNSGKTSGGIHLLAEALAMDSSPKETLPCASTSNSTSTSTATAIFKRKPGGSVFDCNVCFSLCKDPVLTCCGHLFCWACFYCLPNCDIYASKECPVCEGEVLETDITPIYGAAAATPSDHGSLAPFASSSSSHQTIVVKIPPRPRARRIDSARQPQQRGPRISVHPRVGNPPRFASSPNPNPVVFQPRNFSTQSANSLASLSQTSAEHTYFDSGDSVLVNVVAVEQDYPDFIPLYPPTLGTSTIDRINDELNSVASHYLSPSQSQTMLSVGNPASDGSNNGSQAAQPRLSSLRRRSGNDNGLNFREWRRRRDS